MVGVLHGGRIGLIPRPVAAAGEAAPLRLKLSIIQRLLYYYDRFGY